MMSVDDLDGELCLELEQEDFTEELVRRGWRQEAAEEEWAAAPKFVYINDLERRTARLPHPTEDV